LHYFQGLLKTFGNPFVTFAFPREFQIPGKTISGVKTPETPNIIPAKNNYF